MQLWRKKGIPGRGDAEVDARRRESQGNNAVTSVTPRPPSHPSAHPPHLVRTTLTPAPPHLALGFAEVWRKIAVWDRHDIHPYSSPNLDLFFSRVAVKKKNNNKLGIYQAADQ